jgi:hypothetical protein
MADQVIIDDGGSTRIKQLVTVAGNGHMDSLLEVTDPGGGASPHSDASAPGAFTSITIVFLDPTGAATVATGAAIPVGPNHTFTIFSDNNQRVDGRIVAAAGPTPDNCALTVKGIAGTKPIVEAKHSGIQRRYVIANAGPINRVTVNGVGAPQNFPTPPNTIYTTVILN